MRMSTRGRVTIPKQLRDLYGFLPGTEVECWREGKTIFIRKVLPPEEPVVPDAKSGVTRPRRQAQTRKRTA
jgi:AbrB family looped-hinge helix DNA binding protein